jgi:hypothetical protein
MVGEKLKNPVFALDDRPVIAVPRETHGGFRKFTEPDKPAFTSSFDERPEKVVLKIKLLKIIGERQVKPMPDRARKTERNRPQHASVQAPSAGKQVIADRQTRLVPYGAAIARTGE